MVWKTIGEIVLLIIGFVLLVKGADFLVDGAKGLAAKMHVSTFIIGLTVVAVGTSAPEIAVSIVGAVQGNGEIIVGNILGSNIMNILLILGITSLICIIPVEKSSSFIELPFLLVITALFALMGYLSGGFNWWDGLILICLYIVFMAYTIISAKKARAKMPLLNGEIKTDTYILQDEADLQDGADMALAKGQDASLAKGQEAPLKDDDEPQNAQLSLWGKIKKEYEDLQDKVWFLIILTIVGLGCVVGGAELVVNSATFIAEDLFKIPTSIVALTVVAFGTSLPELVTSISAARRGDTALASGNIIGSNIANLLLVGGFGFLCSTKVIAFELSDLIGLGASFIAAALLLAFSFKKGRALTRVCGVIFLICLVIYYTWLFLNLGFSFI